MSKSRLFGTQDNRVFALIRVCSSGLRSNPQHCNVSMDQGRRFLIAGLLSVLALCLASGLLAFIVVEAFDSDLDLWPFGSENFTVAAQYSPVTGGEPIGALTALSVIECFVITAGAHLVLRYRARSALPTDSPILFSPLNVAELRVPSPNAAPVLGHLSYKGPREDWNVSARARLTQLGSPSDAFHLAKRFSS